MIHNRSIAQIRKPFTALGRLFSNGNRIADSHRAGRSGTDFHGQTIGMPGRNGKQDQQTRQTDPGRNR